MSGEASGKIEAILDRISVALLTSLPGDMRKLGEILSSFEEIRGLAEREGLGEVREAAVTADAILTALMFRDDLRDLRDVAFNLVNGLISFCQDASRGGPRNRSALARILGEARERLKVEVEGISAEEVPRQTAPEGEGESVPDSVPLDQDKELYTDFILESKEHLQAIEVKMVDLETAPDDKENINAIFRGFHTIKGVSGFLNLKDVNALSHRTETLLDMCRRGEMPVSSAIIDVVFEAVDAIRGMVDDVAGKIAAGEPSRALRDIAPIVARIERIQSGEAPAEEVPEAEKPLLGDVLVEQGKVSRGDVEDAVVEQLGTPGSPPVGQILIEAGKVAPKDVSQALRVQKAGPIAAQDIRVDVDKLDGLVDMVGELVISQSMVSNDPHVRAIDSPKFYRNLSQLGRITSELQKIAMSMRMVPVRNTFQKMTRLVRDLGKKAGKEVVLIMEGEETEVDRNMVEVIHDPLVHMIRNSVDHGLETEETRVAAGKTAFGRITLRAFHQGGYVVLAVEDDGRGLNAEKILAKARDRGLVGPNDTPSESDIFALVFEPGFSTAEKITDISGRGVGMDVVRKNVEKLRGTIEIKSQAGKGSVFAMKLPLTLAIIDGIVVRVGEQRYVVPANAVVESVRPKREDYFTVENRNELIMVRGDLVPMLRLDRLFSVPGGAQDPTEALVVVLTHDRERRAVLIDELLGKQEVVIKNLGDGMPPIPGVSGGAIMGDGRVGLILDVAGLFDHTGHRAATA